MINTPDPPERFSRMKRAEPPLAVPWLGRDDLDEAARANAPGWMVGLEGGWEQHLFLAEGRCEGSISGRFRAKPASSSQDGHHSAVVPAG
jgi:hypothetical protein